MEQRKLKEIGYRQHYYGVDCDSDAKQCFHCKYGQVVEENREKVQCKKWNITVDEDDICDYFEFATYWAFDCMEEDKERRRIKLENAQKNSTYTKEGCYIATAVYGGYDQPQVMILRKYRDEVLKKSLPGRMFIKIYYFISPCLAEYLKSSSWITGMVRHVIDRFIRKIEKRDTNRGNHP